MKTEPESKVSDEALLRLASAAASPHEVYECIQLSTMDVLSHATMKNAAKCDT